MKKMAILTLSHSVITVHVTRLNLQLKRSKLAEWIQETRCQLCFVQERHTKDIHRLNVKGWIKIVHANDNQKRAEVAILIIRKDRL